MIAPRGSSLLHDDSSVMKKKLGNASTSLPNQNNVASALISIIEEGTIIIAILAILFAYTILKVIMSGILMNRQRKLLSKFIEIAFGTRQKKIQYNKWKIVKRKMEQQRSIR